MNSIVGVTNLSRIRVLHGRFTSGFTQQNGYKVVTIAGKKRRISRLVAEAFLPRATDPECNTVDHIDGDETNNMPSNLRWATMKQQTANRVLREKKTGKSYKNNKASKKNYGPSSRRKGIQNL